MIKLKINEDALKKLSASSSEVLWIYNGLDNIVTRELYSLLDAKLEDEDTRVTYEFERSMLGPALQMQMNGFRVDEEMATALKKELEELHLLLGGMRKNEKGRYVVVDEGALLQELAIAFWEKPLNFNSNKQLKEFFYDALRIPPYHKIDRGQRKVSTAREVLEKMEKAYPRAAPFCKIILRLRDIEKQLQVIEAKRDADGRMRTAFNVAGTETGRWSSKESHFWNGMNLQNVTKKLRAMFIPDPGYTMFYADLKTAESIAVGYLSEDEKYIEACLSGDIHTHVSKLVWPTDLSWTGDLDQDKELAEQLYYRTYSRRYLSKRGGHGTNYRGTPRTIAAQIRSEEKVIHVFQAKYMGGTLDTASVRRWGYFDLFHYPGVEEIDGFVPFRGMMRKTKLLKFEGAFPGIREWHDKTDQEVQSTECLTTPFGRKRHFWGRLNDDATLREATAYVPQSIVADYLNIGLFRVWKHLQKEGLILLANGHDAIVGMVPTGTEEYFEKRIKEIMEFDVPVNGRLMRIPADVTFSKNNWEECS